MAPIDEYELAWPQDDSYRSYIDPSWLRVLAVWVHGLASDPRLRLRRRFFVIGVPCT